MEGDLIFSVCFSKYALLFRSVFVCLLWEHPLFCNHIHYYSVHQAYDSFFGTLLLRTSFHIVLIFVPKVHGDLRIVGPLEASVLGYCIPICYIIHPFAHRHVTKRRKSYRSIETQKPLKLRTGLVMMLSKSSQVCFQTSISMLSACPIWSSG